MPSFDLTNEEHAAVVAALRRLIAEEKFPFSPRLAPLKSALAKLDPSSAPKPRLARPLFPEAPCVAAAPPNAYELPEILVGEASAHPFAHVSSCVVGAKPQSPINLKRADLDFAGEHEVNYAEPLAQ